MPSIPPDKVGWLVTAGIAVVFIALVALIAWFLRR
jgi:hypothetical protein